jgi:alanine racemase
MADDENTTGGDAMAAMDALDTRARVWAEVDLAALEHNYRHMLSRAPAGTKTLAVLKADAYGHGATLCAKKLVELGVSMIGVGDSREALELRAAGIDAPMLILGAIVEGEMRAVVENDVASCIHSAQRAKLLSNVARALGKRARVHLKVDTGMGRLGVRPEIARELAGTIARDPYLELEGVCTHYGSAASPVPFHTSEQVTSFVKLVEEIRSDGVRTPLVHASNSAALFSTLSEHFSMVRVGLGLFGLNPGNLPVGDNPLKPVLSLRTQVVFLKDLPAGSPVGYNRTHVTKRQTRIAIVPFGYSDGYPYALSNRANVLVRGERAPVLGAVSMDYTTIDVTDVRDVQVGEEVTVIGASGKRRIGAEDLARIIGTIPYEITARLGRRVARIAV